MANGIILWTMGQWDTVFTITARICLPMKGARGIGYPGIKVSGGSKGVGPVKDYHPSWKDYPTSKRTTQPLPCPPEGIWDMEIKWVVRILLECFIVCIIYTLRFGSYNIVPVY